MRCSCIDCPNVAIADTTSAHDLCDSCYEANCTPSECFRLEDPPIRAIPLQAKPTLEIVSLVPDSAISSR